MKKVVCLHNVYHDGRFITAGTDVGLPDDVARNWVERGLAKFVGEETPVNPPAVPPVEKPEVKPEEKAANCVKCGKCEEICPQKIAIREDLAKLQSELDAAK